MNANLDAFWLTGIIAVIAGVTVLIVIVRCDLAPVGSPAGSAPRLLDGGGRIFLGAALGIGIIAFSIKLLVVFLLSSFPEKTIALHLLDTPKRAPDHTTPPALQTNMSTPKNERPIWASLPDTTPAPKSNPTTALKVELGKRLFNDVRLSIDRTVSCASCHDLDKHAGADGRAVALGVGAALGSRNTPTVLNASYQARLFWDGRATSLEKQAVGPLLNPIEMAMPSTELVVQRVKEDPQYEALFKAAFPSHAQITMRTIAQALAAYERTLVTHDTPYDRFVGGDETALSQAQKRGMHMFRKLGCSVCHAGANFSGASKIGPQRPFAQLRTDRLDNIQARTLSKDKGRASARDRLGLWRIPSLRNVALTAPYFHNGSVKTLQEAVRIMVRAQVNAVLLPPQQADDLITLNWDRQRRKFDATSPKHVSKDDIEDLVAFLQALSSDRYRAQASK